VYKVICPRGGVTMNKYEITFIVKSDMEEAEIKKTAEAMKKVLTDKNAKILEEKVMGQRELAYEINKMKTGYYFLYVVEADSDTVKEFNRVSGINENLLRHLIVKVED
jgi:ribosomal protein S6